MTEYLQVSSDIEAGFADYHAERARIKQEAERAERQRQQKVLLELLQSATGETAITHNSSF